MKKFVLFFIVPLAIFGNNIPENPPVAPSAPPLPSSPDPNNFVAQFEKDTGLSQIPLQGQMVQVLGDYSLWYDLHGNLSYIREGGSSFRYNFSGSQNPTSVSSIVGEYPPTSMETIATYSLPQKTLTSIMTQGNVQSTVWNYDGQGHLTSINQSSDGTPPFISKSWQYDTSGNISKYSTMQLDPPQSITYSPPNWTPVVGASSSSLGKQTPERTFSPGKSGDANIKLFK